MRYRRSRSLGGEIRNATVSHAGAAWHVAIQVEVPDRSDPPNGGRAVGVDRGVVHALAISDGSFFDLPARGAKEDERLLRLKRKRERQRRGSRNQSRTKQRIAANHSKRARRRHDLVVLW